MILRQSSRLTRMASASEASVATSLVVAFAGAATLAVCTVRARRTFSTSAILLRNDEAGLSRAGKALRDGSLVAFPTETVYGLGANALDPQACRDVFTTKGRPLTDPLIVHVSDQRWAKSLLKLSAKQRAIFDLLAEKFWPGPLTIVALANTDVFTPDAVRVLTADTGMVGVRVPADSTAIRLLNSAKVPIAAPSANRFGHVSPTSAKHVMADLGSFPIYVIEAEEKCNIGIESTVVGLVDIDTKNTIVLFRRGGISEEQLVEAVKPIGLNVALAPSLVRGHKANTKEQEIIPQIAPGQLLTHYAPDNVESFLWEDDPQGLELPHSIKDTIVVDFGGSLSQFKDKALAYRDMSPNRVVDEACRSVFDVLRWTETISGAKAVLLPNVVTVMKQGGSALALDDRLYRAASGRRVGKVGA